MEPFREVKPETRLEAVRPIAERVVRSHGLELFDVQLRREPIGLVLRVTIDRPASRDALGAVVVERPEDAIGIDECQRVSDDLGTVLDVEDAVEKHYTLEVSSPGLDRPLRHVDDYRRFVGRKAKIVVTAAVDGQMHFEGRLLGVEDDGVRIEVGKGREKRLALAQIARARLEVEFR